jgi:autotransporter-associated beta strand protein
MNPKITTVIGLLALIVISAPAQTLTRKWQNLDVASTGNRAVAYNPTTGNILMVQSGQILRFNSANGDQILPNLDVTGVSGGILALSGLAVQKDGTIWACNHVTSPPLKLYRWDDEDAVPVLAAEHPTLPNTDVYGRQLSVFVREGVSTNFIVSGAGNFAFFVLFEGGTWTFKQINISTAAPSQGQALASGATFIDYNAPGFPNRFRVLAKGRPHNGYIYSFDPTTPSPIPFLGTVMGGEWAWRANGITTRDYDPETGLLVGVTSTLQASPFSYTNMIFSTRSPGTLTVPTELTRFTDFASGADSGIPGGTTWGPDGRIYLTVPAAGVGLQAFDVSAFLISAPSSVTKLAGQVVTFETIFGGSGLTYEWTKGATILSDNAKYSGTTNRSLTISDLNSSDADTYTVTATDANSGTASATITLVIAPSKVWTGGGANDNWSTANNWGGTALATSGEGALFAGSTRTTPVMDGSYDVTALAFNSSAAAFTLTASSGSLTLSGPLESESANLQTIGLPIVVNSAQTIDLSGPVTISGSVSGAGDLTKSGGGILTLSATNTHTGGINIDGGTLAVSGGSAIDDEAAVTLAAGATLQVNSPETIGPVTGIFGSTIVSDGLTMGGTANSVHAGAILINSAVKVAGSGNATLSGTISGPGNLEMAGDGTLTMHLATFYTGETILTSGTVSLNDASTLGTGAGTLRFNGGTLFRAPQTTAQTFANPVEVTANSTIAGNPASGTRAVQFGANTLTSTGGTLTITNSAVSGSGVFAVRINGTTANCNIPIVLTQGPNGIVELGFASAATGNQVISGNISGNGRVLKNSAALARQTTFTGSNSYSGNLYILAGRVNLNNNHAAGAGMIVISNATIALAATTAGIVITNNIHLESGANPIIYADGSGSTLELRGVISGADGSSRLTRNNTGNALPILAGDNTFSGGVTIISRTLQLKHRNALGVGGFTIGDSVNAPANTINLSAGVPLTGANAVPNTTVVNQNFTISGTNALELSGPVSLSGIRTITLSGVSSYGKFSGSFYGETLTKAGTGTLELSGTSPYLSGDLTVSAGSLLVNSYLWSGPVTVAANGTVGGTGTLANYVTAEGTVSPGISTGTLTFDAGLDMSSGGTYAWELGALSTAPGSSDVIVLAGGNLALGGLSKLAINFTGTATPPGSGDPFWSSPRTWTIVNLNGGSNIGDTDFYAIANSVYSNGVFTTSVSGGNVLLHFTPGTPPKPEVKSIVGPAAPSTEIEFTTPILRAIYTLLYKDDLNDTNWSVLGSVVGTGSDATIIDASTPKPMQRYYRIVID